MLYSITINTHGGFTSNDGIIIGIIAMIDEDLTVGIQWDDYDI